MKIRINQNCIESVARVALSISFFFCFAIKNVLIVIVIGAVACWQVEHGAMAIFGPAGHLLGSHVQSICDALEVPHLETRLDAAAAPGPFSINVYPPLVQVNRAFLDAIFFLNWTKVAVIYEDDTGETSSVARRTLNHEVRGVLFFFFSFLFFFFLLSEVFIAELQLGPGGFLREKLCALVKYGGRASFGYLIGHIRKLTIFREYFKFLLKPWPLIQFS